MDFLNSVSMAFPARPQEKSLIQSLCAPAQWFDLMVVPVYVVNHSIFHQLQNCNVSSRITSLWIFTSSTFMRVPRVYLYSMHFKTFLYIWIAPIDRSLENRIEKSCHLLEVNGVWWQNYWSSYNSRGKYSTFFNATNHNDLCVQDIDIKSSCMGR